MKLVRRSEWGARKARNRSSADMRGVSSGHWNGPDVLVRGAREWSHDQCAGVVRGIQNFHMDGRGWSDIAYNFLPCPHGYVFEGRGLNTINAANGTNQGNRTAHAIMMPAGPGNPFTLEQKQAFRDTVRYIADNTNAPDAANGHRDHKSTECPGEERYRWIHAGMPISGSPSNGGDSPAPPRDPGTPLLKLGNQGHAVAHMQQIIFTHAGGNIAVDGYFGPGTKARVRDVQRMFGLVDDGVVGPATWAALNYLATPRPAETPKVQYAVLRLGSKGHDVAYLQQVIVDHAGGGLTVDGDYGPNTEARVKDLQRFFGLPVDGVVGPQTWAVVEMLAAS